MNRLTSIFDRNTAVYRWEIPKFSEETRNATKAIYIRGLPWQIETRRIISTSNEDTLNVYLHRTNNDDALLTCFASASIELMSYDDNVQPHRKVIAPAEFGAKNPPLIGVPLISIGDLMQPERNYIKNDTIVLKVKVEVDSPQKLQKVFANDFTRLEILSSEHTETNVSTLKLSLTANIFMKTVGISSPPFILDKTQWQICVSRNDDMLGIHLKLFDKAQLNCKYDVNFTMKLLPFDQNQDAHEKRVVARIDADGEPIGCKFIPWTTLFDPMTRYVQKNAINMELVIEAKEVANSQAAIVGTLECPICFESLFDRPIITSLKCGHMYCQDCIERGVTPRKKCAVCNFKALRIQHRRIYLTGYGIYSAFIPVSTD